MDDLLNKLNNITEETTSADIAYAPGPLRPATPEAKALVKDKSRKLNKEAEKRALEKDKEIDKVAEALATRSPVYKDAIVRELDSRIKESRLSILDFRRAFPKAQDVTQKSVLIRYASVQADEAAVKSLLPEDAGELQIILASLERGDAVTVDEFNKILYIYGARMISTLYGRTYGESLMYAGYMDKTFTEKETLYVKSVDLLDAIKQMNPGKIVGATVYPTDGIFRKGFFDAIREEIDKEDKHE
jgi:hypothetical protein